MEHAKGERDEFVSVALGEVGDGADETRAWTAQLVASFADRVLADDGALVARARFFESAQGGEGADVVDGADQSAPDRRSAEVLADDLEDLLEISAAIEVGYGDIGSGWKFGAEAVEKAGYAEFEQGSGDGKFEEDELVDFAVPVFACPAAQSLATDEAGFVVICAEVGGAGVRNFDGDDGRVRLEEFGGDYWSYALVGLVFEDEVDALLDEKVGVAQGLAR